MDLYLIIIIAILGCAIVAKLAAMLYCYEPQYKDIYTVSQYAHKAVDAGRQYLGITDKAELAGYVTKALQDRFPQLGTGQLQVIVGAALSYIFEPEEATTPPETTGGTA